LVSDEEKLSLLRNCSALFQPSENESFSRVVMEAWMHGKPVAAHRLCLATAVAVERSGGGWLAEAEEEWAQRFADVAHLDDRQLASLGTRGQAYARHLANWDEAMARLEKALAPDDPTSPRVASLPKGRVRTINQFLPNLAYGDAISNHALWIRKSLRDLGYNSEIYVRFIDPRCASECRVFSPGSLAESDAAVYHHSVGSEITSHLLGFRGPRCLIYHNITPPEYYAPYRPDFAEVLRSGKRDLSSLADHFPLSYAVSRYNAEELRGAGFREPRVMPLPVDPGVWTIRADQTVMEELQDGRTNLLYVGRMAPNKKQDDLIRAFESYLSFEPDARLILVGKAEDADPYYAYVTELVRQYQLEEHVLLPGNIDAAQLAAYYSCADLFWSMSEHEGFCVPLVEAMWFDVPVLAYRSTAIPETLGEAGLMFTDKDDVASVAAAAHLLVSDRELRRKSITAQRRRRVEFLPEKVGGYLLELVKQLEDFSPGNN
jgi:glycosyltransferase involved in cell wall biosynthesis